MFPSQPLVSSAVKRRRKKNRAGRPRAARKTPLTLEQLEPRVLLDAANERYVARLYEQILQRQPETAGLAGWTALLDRGHSRQEVAAGIVGSQEHRDQQVQFFYRTLLGRLGSPTEVHGWTQFLASGASLSQVRGFFLGSIEYGQVRGQGTTDGFLASVYRDVLGREIEPGGRTGWTQFLAGGASHAQAATLIVDSLESRNLQVLGFYRDFLDRSASSAEIQAWVNALQSGLPVDLVEAGFLGSEEYFVRFIDAGTRLASQPAVAVPGQPGQTVSTTFTITSRDTAFDNEFGLFSVADASGRIGDLKPGDPGYAVAALAAGRKQQLFAADKAVRAITLDLPAGAFFGFYLIQNQTSAGLAAANPNDLIGHRPYAFFSFRAANPDRIEHVHELPGNIFAFEDLFAGETPALVATGIIAFILIIFGIAAIKVLRDKRRSDEEREERRRRRGY